MKKTLLAGFIVVSILACSFPVMADKLSEVKKQANYVENKLDKINKEKKEEKGKLKDAQEQKQELANDLQVEDSEYKEKLRELGEMQRAVKESEDAVMEAENIYNSKKELMKTRLRVLYETSCNPYTETLIESKDMGDFLSKMEYISLVAQKDKELIATLEAAKKDLEYKRAALEDAKRLQQKRVSDSVKELQSLKSSRAELDNEIKELSIRIEKLEAEEDALIKKSEELADTIQSLSRRGTKYAGGAMSWPVPSSTSVVSYYGLRIHPIYKKKKMHTGIDIDARSGVSIEAANKGVVIVAGWQGGYGNTVVVDHGGGITTLYAHCSRILVSEGQTVKTGTVIAKVGSTGLSTGPHLHFEVRRNGKTTNPLQYFGR
ncbi:MAG: peptidoglycan DD-metalloendopeptidase family protein [Clostridia bacterium]|nr:peptidoglycan DD-metalloendopeptidase family protein [Clostridia bacterium]